ncbi:HTH-type transcriptional repressor AseR [Enhygromyxa salina]|uniref:HTH-type transcriptional repressor AseR n=1 Tax=Enhygromyxa salina TaxID=215803 RepID=A0A2S9YEH1_9BACT|nr:metalloregulator ArsR/SmtB family transcription factor [Enhygromyxa salina]PRQ03411.1 HTH-type transcriptional repressor AseR [Enhygromyxa salina]
MPRSSAAANKRPAPSLGECAASLKALADPTRLEIVSLVAAAKEPLCACEIEAHFDLSQSTISHHLGLLRKAGVLNAERRGTWAFYSITKDAASPLATVMSLLDS